MSAEFSPTSRYFGSETTSLPLPDGTQVTYLCRRFVPQPGRFSLIMEHTVVGGERLDNLAAQYLGDSGLFWRLCDANGALWPDELTEQVGRVLRITLPEGIAGPQ